MKEVITSVGIDIGTTTTQLILSRLHIENTASMFQVPRINIVDRQVIYRSNIYFTPLYSAAEINADKLKQIILNEYDLAGIKPEEINTGAVIITGETSRKKNAEAVAKAFAEIAGSFVVATAGPDLESIIAGKGAGADKISSEKHSTVIHFDIGGGTTNISVFDHGELIDTGCLDIGGRLIRINSEGCIDYIAPKIITLAENKNIKISKGMPATEKLIENIVSEMVEIVKMSAGLIIKDKCFANIITNHNISEGHNAEYVTFSGGVADLIYEPENKNIFKYDDVGVLLARGIAKSEILRKFKLVKPSETIRATVIGAGTHTVDVSGSTIFYSRYFFPLKNIPIVKFNLDEEKKECLSKNIQKKLKWYKFEDEQHQVAIAINGCSYSSFADIEELSKAVIEGTADIRKHKGIVIVLTEKDIAKVLGQTLFCNLECSYDVLCIDNISVDNGDYIDIGYPVADGNVVPVIIKTLIFKT
jgi:ethanolamine utilization protein EutA